MAHIIRFEVESYKAFSHGLLSPKAARNESKLILFGHKSESTVPAWLTRLAGSVLLSQSFN